MSLETRVETLEHELKILKNEIETTLLEIQNQVLIHYYPVLRAEETPPSKPPLRPNALTSPADELPAKREENQPVQQDAMLEPLPKTREISLQEMKRKVKLPAAPAEQASTPVRNRTPTPKEADLWPEAVIDQAVWPYVAKWVNESVDRIGKELTQNLINSSLNAEATTPGLTELLLQFVTVSEEVQPDVPVTTRDLMDVLLKLNKMLDQVAGLMETTPTGKGAAHGQGDYDDVHDHR